jgi:alpha-methylacyl-CoA racemase
LEPQFFKVFIERFVREVEVAGKLSEWVPTPAMQKDIAQWPKMKQYFENGFLTRDRNYWGQLFHGTFTSEQNFASKHI